MKRILLMVTFVLAAGACGDSFSDEPEPGPVEPADFAGSYSVNFTNGEDGCRFGDWTEGETTTGVPVSVVQEDASVTATVEGLVGSLLDLWIGSHRLSGSVAGNAATLTLLGAPRNYEGCVSIVDATYEITLSGDAISGTVTYNREAVSGTCSFPEACESYQQLSGARAPQ